MKAQRICLLVVALTLTGTHVFSQEYFGLGKLEDVKETKTREVLVLLEEEDPKLVAKLSKKPAELAEYRSEIKRVNEILPQIVNKFWHFTGAPTTKTRSEIKKLTEAKNKDYSVISLDRTKVTTWGKSGYARYEIGSKVIAILSIILIEDIGRGYAVFYQNLPNIYATEGDMALGIQMMQNFLQARLDGKKRNEISDEANEYKSLLSGKTLLVDKEDIKAGLTDAQIKEVYPHPFKVVDYATIEKAILENDKQYAVVQIIPLTAGVPANAHLVMSTVDGKTLAYYAPVQASVLGKSTEARVSARHFKNYVK